MKLERIRDGIKHGSMSPYGACTYIQLYTHVCACMYRTYFEWDQTRDSFSQKLGRGSWNNAQYFSFEIQLVLFMLKIGIGPPLPLRF